MLFLLLVSKFYLACQIKLDVASQDSADCWLESAVQPVEGVLNGDDSCQIWEISVGAHAYISLQVSSEETSCESDVDVNVSIPYAPTYSNMGNEGPKWTFDVMGESVGEGHVHISCQDGTVWNGYFIVRDASQ